LSPLPSGASTFFTGDEVAHMTDVRAVFRGAEGAGVLALFVGAFRIERARRRGGALRLVRAGALASAGVVTFIGLAAAVAFDPLFLLFHDVFFPQGNFLFDPATSNLLRLYPEWYWQGITAGVGASFIALALLTAVMTHRALHRRSNTYTRAA
jgi:integral membrane protein (TIGR01906 family)